MVKNDVLPNRRDPSSDSSEEETGSSDEETENEEQAEGGSDFESESDERTDAPKKVLTNSAVKAAASAAAATAGCPAKRIREATGKKDKEDGPLPKKKKSEVTTPVQRAPSKPMAEQLEKKSSSKAERGKPTPPVKEKPSTVEKKSAPKRKNATVHKSSGSSRSGDETHQKRRNLSRPWLPDEELAVSRELQRDRVNDVYGSSLPSSRSDSYWEKLINRFSFMDKYEKKQRIERLYEKVKRMRLRYAFLSTRLRAGETTAYKNSHEKVLWQMWDTIWGPEKATLKMLNCDRSEKVDEEEEDGSDEGSEEDEQEDIVMSQGKRGQAAVGRASAEKKVVVLDETSSDDDPVKVTPPAVLAARAVPEITTSKSVPTKGLAVPAMDVDSVRNTSLVAVHNGAQGGHCLIPEMIEKTVSAVCPPAVSDVIRAENLALLRDMRGMVEETKLQTGKFLEDTRVKTTQIMEELRLLEEKLGSIAGQRGRTDGSYRGHWSDMSDNPFQGMGLLGIGQLPLGDPFNVKWRDQWQAEQGLILQRLQLVQDQARVQQDGIRLKLNIQKQQNSAQGKQA